MALVSLTITPVNDRPVLNLINSMTVDEGSTLSFLVLASDVDNDRLTYGLLDPSPGASLDPVTGRFTWTPTDGDATYHFTVQVSDPGGLSAERGFDVRVTNVAPTLTAGGYTQTYTGTPYVLNLSNHDPGQDTITSWTFDWGDGSKIETVSGNPPTVTHTYTAPGKIAISVSATDEDGRNDLAPFELTVQVAPLQVTWFGFDSNGFAVRFNEAFDPAVINLYDSALTPLGAADVTLIGATTGAIRGSLLMDTDQQGFRFLKTGAPLAADSYTLTLKSGANAFHGPYGNLDGNGDFQPGDDFVQSFTVSPPGTLRLSLPDFMRGPGQVVNVPAAMGNGIPVTLNSRGEVHSVQFTVRYDPALLTITGATRGSGLPTGATLTVDTSQAGLIQVSIDSPTDLAVGKLNLINLQAEVPLTAPYTARQVLDIGDTVVNGVAVEGMDDDALHVVGYLGDTTGNQRYEKDDVTLIQRIVVKADSGFAAWRDLDPLLVADIDGNGVISSLDATRVYQELSGVDRPEIPPLPTPEAVAAARAAATVLPAAATTLPTATATGNRAGTTTPTLATTATPVSTATAPADNHETAATSLPTTGSPPVAQDTGQPANTTASKPMETPIPPVRLDLNGSYTGFRFPINRQPAQSDWRQAFVTNLAAPLTTAEDPNAALRITLPPRVETTRQEERVS